MPNSPDSHWKRLVVGFGTEFMVQAEDEKAVVLVKVLLYYQKEASAPDQAHPTEKFYALWGVALHSLATEPSRRAVLQEVEVLMLKSEDINQSWRPDMWQKHYVPFLQLFSHVTELRLSSFTPFLWKILSLHAHEHNGPPRGVLPNLKMVKILASSILPISNQEEIDRNIGRCAGGHSSCERARDKWAGAFDSLAPPSPRSARNLNPLDPLDSNSLHNCF
ncbi:hypothetical protein H1R20_g15410, partial [Candolleomyces eurysporus]